MAVLSYHQHIVWFIILVLESCERFLRYVKRNKEFSNNLKTCCVELVMTAISHTLSSHFNLPSKFSSLKDKFSVSHVPSAIKIRNTATKRKYNGLYLQNIRENNQQRQRNPKMKKKVRNFDACKKFPNRARKFWFSASRFAFFFLPSLDATRVR